MIIASAILLALAFVALFGERLAPHEPIYFVLEQGRESRPFDPGVVFPFGSDVLGRDLFSLVLSGARATLTIVLLAGAARVAAGVLIAAVGSWWRPTRLVTETLAELVSAVPATLVALVLVKVFVTSDSSTLFFVGALLVIGWAGPYRVIRAEVERLANAPFTEGARAIGVARWRLFWRHQLPHLVPMLAVNLTQQVIASLVLVAELGVLSVFVGATRLINVEESLTIVRTGQPTTAIVGDPVEWGGLLATSRTVEALWTTRWLILLPGIAFALTALAIAVVGFAFARRYARRDLIADLRGRGAAGLGLALVAVFAVSAVVPERYPLARAWASEARAAVRPAADVNAAFAAAGLRPIGDGYEVRRDVSRIVQAGPASVRVGATTVTEPWPRQARDTPDRDRNARSFAAASTGGGSVEAPLVFVARGISASDFEPRVQANLGPPVPDLAKLIRDYSYADDYAGVDVRGKVVVLVRFLGIRGAGPRLPSAIGPSPEASIANAIGRGAAAVLFVDPALGYYTDLDTGSRIYGLGDVRGGTNPYLRAEQEDPPTSEGGVPVVVLSDAAASAMLRPFGIDLAPFFAFDERGDPRWKASMSRDLGVAARVQVPLRYESASVVSHVGEVAGAPDDAKRVLVWGIRRPDAVHPAGDDVAALARALGATKTPVVLVDFDPSVDAAASADAIRRMLGERRIALVVVLDRLDGDALQFTTPHGDLIPAFDLYADNARARHRPTLRTASLAEISGLAPFVDVRTVLVKGTGGDGDPRADAASLIGYLAGRLALGAEELR